MSSRNSSKNSSGVFVVIKGERCGYCKRLNPSLPEIKKEMQNRNIEYIEYEVAEMWNPPNGKNGMYPESLGYEGIWYPFIFYTTTDNWNMIKVGKDLRNKISIMNGSFDGRSYVLEQGVGTYNPMKIDHVIKWLEDILNKVTITSQIVSPKSINSILPRPVTKSKSPPSSASNRNTRNTRKKTTTRSDSKNDIKMKIVPRKKYGK